MKTTVSEKGQLTIPKALRNRLGIRPGQVVEVTEERGRLILTKADDADPLERMYGVLATEPSSDAQIAAMRGEPDAL